MFANHNSGYLEIDEMGKCQVFGVASDRGQRCRHFIGADTEWRRQVPSAHARDLYTMCTAAQCGPGDHGEQISYY